MGERSARAAFAFIMGISLPTNRSGSGGNSNKPVFARLKSGGA
jgi:hypothetical protein